MAKIIITRKKATGGAAQSHDVFLVNQYIGELKNGGTIEIPVDVGTHLLTFNSKKSFGQSTTFTCVVNYPNEVVEIQTKVSFSGDYVVEYADNAPHIPVVNATPFNTQDATQPFVNSAPIIHPKKKKSKGLTITIVVLAFIFLYVFLLVLSSAINGTDDTTTTGSGDSSVSSLQKSEPEIEYIEVTANDLWNAFDDNEVAAEEKYNGKPVKVTGVISEINSAGTLTSANILLKADGAFLGCVQCNFNSSNAKALANLQKGQSVTITGTCGKLSITNIMISGCKVVE